MLAIEIVYWTSLLLIVYVYFGYPVVLHLLRWITGGRPVEKSESIRPNVTLIISAYNEESVIADKIRNSLAIDYPKERLEVLVVSDASDDNTDAIVKDFENGIVRLLRMQERGGKTLGLNEAVKSASGEILVFSDANAMYRQNALTMLVRNFEDAAVGAVVGESTYSDSSNDAEVSESLYWRYEVAIKSAESRLGSVVGGDGAIYAIRKKLYQPMASDALSDYVNPCQIVAQGLRCIYEPAAVSVEEAAGSFEKEFKRKVRIVNRAWRATMSMRSLMNPARNGLFAFQLISHKFLRWLIPALLVVAFVTNAILAGQHWSYQLLLVVQLLFYGLALAGAVFRRSRSLHAILYVPYYFCLVNAASALGIIEAYRGETYTTWSTARTDG